MTVQFNYHVELREDRHHYSVPWRLRRRDLRTKVKLLYDERTVSIYYDNAEKKQMPTFQGNLFPHRQIALKPSA